MNCRDYAKTRKKIDEYIKKLVNIIRKITPDEGNRWNHGREQRREGANS